MADNREYFVPFKLYPAFRRLSVQDIHAVERIGREQFRWAAHDIDIETAALDKPHDFPLSYSK